MSMVTVELQPGNESKSSADCRDAIYTIDPLSDPRWASFVIRHPRSSVFHSLAWLKALRQTYGYEPIAYTASAPKEDLRNALVFVRVISWLTGRRLVSLPFSDHCDPLVSNPSDLQQLFTAIENESANGKWRYIEVRPTEGVDIATSLSRSTEEYKFHELDLSPDLSTLFSNLHKNSIQRKILRAEREHLKYDEGTSPALLDSFYRLLVLTRKRHRVPAQPRRWFLSLIANFGDQLKIRVASKDGRAVAGMLTLRHKDKMVYKYGCSDTRFNKLGSIHLLYWNSIQEAKTAGLRFFDFGRTDADQSGLITFKERWGGVPSTLTYSRYSLPGISPGILDPTGPWKVKVAKRIFQHVPASVLSAIGTRLYKHVG